VKIKTKKIKKKKVMIKIFTNEDFLSIYFCPKLQEDYCTSQNILENFDFELKMKENERLKFELEKLKAERIESSDLNRFSNRLQNRLI
jgi:hypothetical protein